MNKTESIIKDFLTSIRIEEPYQLSIKQVSSALNLSLYYWEETSEAALYRGKYYIFIDCRLSIKDQWKDFAHELCHVLNHAGTQNNMISMFLELQEYQAEYFTYHFCVPTFMLEQIKGVDVYEIMRRFNVDFNFALRRLEMYKNKFIDLMRSDYHGTGICATPKGKYLST